MAEPRLRGKLRGGGECEPLGAAGGSRVRALTLERPAAVAEESGVTPGAAADRV